MAVYPEKKVLIEEGRVSDFVENHMVIFTCEKLFKIIFVGFLLSVLVQSLSSSVWASSEIKILAEADAEVFEALPNTPKEQHNLKLLSAGKGRGRKEGSFISYVRFDLNPLPKSDWLSTTAITHSQLSLLAQSFGLAKEEERFFVTVSSCTENDWEEALFTWETRVCRETRQEGDSTIIQGQDLPAVYTWNVTENVSRAHVQGERKLTFVIEAFLMQNNPREIVPRDVPIGFVRFWSRERVKFGANAVPTLTVKHESSSTRLVEMTSSSIAVLSALGVLLGLYQGFLKFRKKLETAMGLRAMLDHISTSHSAMLKKPMRNRL